MIRLVELPAEPSLLGADFEAVRRRYGPPLRCSHGNGLLRFAYAGPRSVWASAVVVADGVVVRMAAGIRPSQGVVRPFHLLGAQLAEVLDELGPVLRRRSTAGGIQLQFASAVVVFALDQVVDVRAADLTTRP